MKKNFFLALALAALVLTSATKAMAQEKMNLIVGPVRQELFLDPGESDQVEVRFYNQSDMPVSGAINVVDFTVSSNDGGTALIDDPEAASPKFSGAKWITLPYSEMSIAALNKVSVPVNINVPADAKAGGRYVAIYFQPISGKPQSTGTGVTSRIASLLYIRVNGEITENAMVTSFKAPNFSEYGPVTVNSEILNRGDYHITPNAIVAMTNMFGSLVDQVKMPQVNIFPDASRLYSTEVGPKWLFGRYKLTLMGSYGAAGKALEASTYVWVMPWRIIAIVILGILLVSILVNKIMTARSEQVDALQGKLEKEEEEIELLKKMLKEKNE